MIAKRGYVRECAGICSVGKPRRRWTDTVKNCLREGGLDVRQARRMMENKIEGRRLVMGNL